MTIRLKAQTSYITRDGDRVNIQGPVREYGPTFPVYWSIAGDWYWEDGRRLSYDKEAGHIIDGREGKWLVRECAYAQA
jgi:hypothetical protein